MSMFVPFLVALAVAVSGNALAEGGKNRYASDLITEGYQLCEQQGAESVTVYVGEHVIVLDCEDAPGPEFPGDED